MYTRGWPSGPPPSQYADRPLTAIGGSSAIKSIANLVFTFETKRKSFNLNIKKQSKFIQVPAFVFLEQNVTNDNRLVQISSFKNKIHN